MLSIYHPTQAEKELSMSQNEKPVSDRERGRPPMFDKKMVQTAVWLPAEMLTWLKAQPVTASEVIRQLIEKAMA
jgi:hypothetical protein